MNNKWKPGDIVMGFGNPVTQRTPLGQARLHKFVQESDLLELWIVEYLNQPGQFYELWIRKKDNEIEKNEITRNKKEGGV